MIRVSEVAIVLVAVGLVSGAVGAAEPAAARAVNAVNAVDVLNAHVGRLQSTQPTPSVFRDWVREVFAAEEVGRLLLGPHYRNAKPDARDEVATLLVELVAARMWNRRDFVTESRVSCSATDEAHVVHCSIGEKKKHRVTVRLRRDKSWKVVDVEVGDFRFLADNRPVVERLVRAGGVEALIERLRASLRRARQDRPDRHSR